MKIKQIHTTTPSSNRLQIYLNSNNIWWLSVVMLIVGLPTSNSLMSWGQFGMALAWLVHGNFAERLQNLKKQKQVLVFLGIYLLFVLGMFWTSDLQQGFKELRIKLPLLVIPFMVSTFPALTAARAKLLWHFLLATLVFTTGLGVAIYFQWISWDIHDIRKISPFISNVRLATLLCFGIVTCWASAAFKWNYWMYAPRWLYGLLGAWFLFFLVMLQSLTGMVVLLVVFTLGALYLSWKRGGFWRWTGIILAVGLPVMVGVYMYSVSKRLIPKEHFVVEELPLSTPSGAIYKYYPEQSEFENGYHVWMYVCNWELKKYWNQRSAIPIDGLNAKGDPIRFTLIRYLTSKGLKKNKEAVLSLSDTEVKAIENGVANYLHLRPWSPEGRVYDLLRDFDIYTRTGDPNGQSFSIRLEIWKHTLPAIRQNMWTGVGTGDVPNTLDSFFKASHTKLEPKWWMNPHNQYLTIFLSLGLGGILYFIIGFLYPAKQFSADSAPFFFLFLLITFVAMLDEDTLETQAGATQVAFMYAWLRWGIKPKNHA